MEKMIGTTNGTNGINDIINGEKKAHVTLENSRLFNDD